MAASRTPQEAIEAAQAYIGGQPFSDISMYAAQSASDRIWNAAPWHWSIGTLSPITITAGAQEFNVVSEPTDILRLEQAYFGSSTENYPLTPVAKLPSSVLHSGIPRYVQYVIVDAGTDIIRFEKLVTSFESAKTYKFFGWYKKIAPNIANDLNTAGALVMDDSYYHVFEDFVLYYAYRYANDSRAGSAQLTVDKDGNRVVNYTGQLGVAMASLEEMRLTESLIPAWPRIPDPMETR